MIVGKLCRIRVVDRHEISVLTRRKLRPTATSSTLVVVIISIPVASSASPFAGHDFLRDLKERILLLFDEIVTCNWRDEPVILCNITFADVFLAARLASELLLQLPRVHISGSDDSAEDDDEFVQVLGAQVSDRLRDDFFRRRHVDQLNIESVFHCGESPAGPTSETFSAASMAGLVHAVLMAGLALTHRETHLLTGERIRDFLLHLVEQVLKHMVELLRMVVEHRAEHWEAVNEFQQATAKKENEWSEKRIQESGKGK